MSNHRQNPEMPLNSEQEALLLKLPHAQRERLAFIDFSLEFIGEISRAELIGEFQVGSAAATRDFAAYKELAKDNMHLVHQTKSYHRTEVFIPLFAHDPETVLTSMAQESGAGASQGHQHNAVCFDAVRLVSPKRAIISSLMRAIHSKKAVDCCYVSMSSGQGERVIVPHSIVHNGHRWHVRAFDRGHGEFRDFVCTRFLKAEVIDESTEVSEQREFDKQWNRIVDLELIAHPELAVPQAVELDYEMTDGKLTLEVRAALAGYLLRQWNVDCSEKHMLSSDVHQLALANPQTLYGVTNLAIAPGVEESMI
ncbi:WYL domain-containing protein [Vibrio profundum]|uniref:WYL domain-containing protein n=1 Tax=Vibrio profundum TaxID=2910247 RepID=UPI003D0BC039